MLLQNQGHMYMDHTTWRQRQREAMQDYYSEEEVQEESQPYYRQEEDPYTYNVEAYNLDLQQYAPNQDGQEDDEDETGQCQDEEEQQPSGNYHPSQEYETKI